MSLGLIGFGMVAIILIGIYYDSKDELGE